MAIIIKYNCKMSWIYFVQSMKFVTSFYRLKLYRVIYWLLFYQLKIYTSKLFKQSFNNFIWFEQKVLLHQCLLIMSADWGAQIQSPMCLSPQFFMWKNFFSLIKTLIWRYLGAHKNSPILVRFWPIAQLSCLDSYQRNELMFFSRNQLPNHGLRAGAKYGGKLETATSASSSVPQVNPPFPSHPIFGMAHPPVLPQWGPFANTSVLFNSLPCNQTFSTVQNDSSSELNKLSYTSTSFDTSTNSSVGSARAASGGYSPPVFGPDRWEKHLRGQSSRGDVDVLSPDSDEDDSMEVSDADTEILLSRVDDEESEVTLSEDSDLSQDKIKVIRPSLATKSVSLAPSWPPSPQSSSSSSGSIMGISPVVPLPTRPTFVCPTRPVVCPRPRLPTLFNNCFQQPTPTLVIRPGFPPFPSELSRPALPLRATTPRPVRPAMSASPRPFSTPRP